MNASSNSVGGILVEPVTQRDHGLGPEDAAVTIVEYGDYECPTCLNAVPVIEEIMQRLGERLRFVFRHFPQNSIHAYASAAAEAAEAAAEQGKFWEMHRALFEHQKQLAEIDFSHLALTLGLEVYAFENDRSREKHRSRIAADFDGGLRSGVRKTPTLFINGRQYEGSINAGAIIAAAESSSG